MRLFIMFMVLRDTDMNIFLYGFTLNGIIRKLTCSPKLNIYSLNVIYVFKILHLNKYASFIQNIFWFTVRSNDNPSLVSCHFNFILTYLIK